MKLTMGIKLTTGMKNLWNLEIQSELQTTRNK